MVLGHLGSTGFEHFSEAETWKSHGAKLRSYYDTEPRATEADEIPMRTSLDFLAQQHVDPNLAKSLEQAQSDLDTAKKQHEAAQKDWN